MLNWQLFSVRNLVIIGLIALIWSIVSQRVLRIVQDGANK